ncbi:MAG: tetraacyldisaccharide 4'-kinase [Planctomycetota bacterium]
MRCLLSPAALVYSCVVRLRNSMYAKGWLRTLRVDALVISVGNITTGGTGKTPLVSWLYNRIFENSRLKRRDCRCAILTRGYKTRKGMLSDEPAILAKSCPEAKVIVNPDRAAAANEAVNRWNTNILIMDDGFQHRRLCRDLDVVTIDATCPFGYGRILPAGLLREPITALKRADAVVVTRCDKVTDAELHHLEERLRLINPNMSIAKSIHAPVCAKSLGRKEIGLEEIRGKNVLAFCGIGNPDAFLSTIKNLGFNLVGSRVYNDHHCCTNEDLADIHKEARYLNADLIMTTQKDWSKIFDSNFAMLNSRDIPFTCLAVELKIIAGEDQITQLIERAFADKIS